MAWVTRPATGTPDSHTDAMGVDPPRPEEEGMSYLERSPIRSAHPRTTGGATQREGVGEVSRGHSRRRWGSHHPLPKGRIFDARSSRTGSMNAEQPKGNHHHGDAGTGGTPTASHGSPQAFTAPEPSRALTSHLMEQVCDPKNLLRAYRRVRANKGKPGVDGMTVNELEAA